MYFRVVPQLLIVTLLAASRVRRTNVVCFLGLEFLMNLAWMNLKNVGRMGVVHLCVESREGVCELIWNNVVIFFLFRFYLVFFF